MRSREVAKPRRWLGSIDQHGRRAEWQAYLDGLLELHARKYKLVPMLRGLR